MDSTTSPIVAARSQTNHRPWPTGDALWTIDSSTVNLGNILHTQLTVSEQQGCRYCFQLEAERMAERDVYRALIADMAATCRTLQRRIDHLKHERDTSVNNTDKIRRITKRRTWPTLTLLEASSMAQGTRAPSVFTTPHCDPPAFYADDIPLGFDYALLLKAFLWY
ncbi:hypothetical protein BDW22DRAFT_909002 [Trametopsis cervina]|nr:hypothetical protein BDW22DRAFT_909002 [Trametopsis cervina]